MRTDFSDKMSSCVLDIVDDFSPHVIGSLYFLNLNDLVLHIPVSKFLL